jgi:N-acetylmuramoyl-L-alanine amidase
MRNKVIFYDVGHGKINPSTGKYVTAPGKMFKHNEFTFYEGVKNQLVAKQAIAKMTRRGITVVPVAHEWQDTSLWRRVKVANEYHTHIQKGIYFSEHSDASPRHNARGFAIWTSPGQTQSDIIAEKGIEMYKKAFSGKIPVRKQVSDGDSDYEARFKVLMDTKMPAILFENLFFDNVDDVKLLTDKKYLDKYTTYQADLADWCTKL